MHDDCAISIELRLLLLKALEKTTLKEFSFADAEFYVEFTSGKSIFHFSKNVMGKIIKPSFRENSRNKAKGHIYNYCYNAMCFPDDDETIEIEGLSPEECIHPLYFLVADYVLKLRPNQRLRGHKDSVEIKFPKNYCPLPA